MPQVQALNYMSERSGHGHSRTRTLADKPRTCVSTDLWYSLDWTIFWIMNFAYLCWSIRQRQKDFRGRGWIQQSCFRVEVKVDGLRGMWTVQLGDKKPKKWTVHFPPDSYYFHSKTPFPNKLTIDLLGRFQLAWTALGTSLCGFDNDAIFSKILISRF